MKKILVLTLILNTGFCSGLPSNANGDRHQLRMSFSDAFECPAQGLETKANSYTVNNGDTYNGPVNNGIIINNGPVNNGTIDSVTINYYNYAVAPNVKAAGTSAQGKK